MDPGPSFETPSPFILRASEASISKDEGLGSSG